MHRSGTSLITHWLHACGLQLGDKMLDSGKGNVEGHFEDLDFLQEHEAMLAARGSDTAGLRGPFDIVPNQRERSKLAALVAVKNAAYPQWGWKEPRTCLFLDTYNDLLPEAKYLVVLRDYQEVVHSLLKRDFSYIDEKYQSRSWPYRMAWKYGYRNMRMKQHRAKYHDRYLQAWIAYNKAILKALHTLPDERYLVVSYESMKHHCGDVFNVLTSHWGFFLQYKKFSSIYRSELISQCSQQTPDNADANLLAEAQRVTSNLAQYLQCRPHVCPVGAP